LIGETGPQIAGNRFDRLGSSGVFAFTIAGRIDIVENRLVQCARAPAANATFVAALGCLLVEGEANIVGNEIMDTGGDAATPASSPPAYGIYGLGILEARVAENLVTYSDASKRDPLREDRALLMMGLLEFSQSDQMSFGFAIQIHGNKFVGNGRTALVQLIQTPYPNNPTFLFRFERVSFDQNYCMHVTPPGDPRRGDATVVLVGKRGIVTGNHIKATTRNWPSVNFNQMPAPFIANVTAGGAINQSGAPTPATDYNLIAN
jgi:hypothetical protein